MASLEQIFSENRERGETLAHLQDYLRERRDGIRSHHQSGAGGAQIVGYLTALMDDVLHQGCRRALMRLLPEERDLAEGTFVLVALGGYGRGELNPHSDVDLMFLYREQGKEVAEEVSREMLHLLWDLKFSVGHSFRTLKEALEIGRTDYPARTAMMESRLLAGSEALFRDFKTAFRQMAGRDVKAFVEQKTAELNREHQEYGSTVYLLEPNVKRSEGGLRDIHHLRWISMACYQSSSLAQLHQRGLLSDQDYRLLGQGQDFLWRVRNDLHFHSGRATDVLYFDEQERLAGFFGFEKNEHLLGVERFMQYYYIHTARIHDIVTRFRERAVSPPLVRRIFDRMRTRNIEGVFLVGPQQISLSPRVPDDYLHDAVHLVDLFRRARDHGVPISKETLERISMAVVRMPVLPRLDEACRRFCLLLSQPGGLGELLRLMHRSQLLWRFLPEYERINRLVQFNRYHKYTVDEHSIRAVEEAEALVAQNQGPLSHVYREIKRKEILHLALLLHDVGKGLAGDHSREGVRIAMQVAEHLQLTTDETHLLLFLVEKHLLMSHIAFRRDLSDPKVLLLFAQEVRTSDVLRMLLILTYADIQAVGPGTWTTWKGELLLELYEKTLEELTGAPARFSEEERIQSISLEVRDRLARDAPVLSQDWIDAAFAGMNRRYLLVTPVERIARDLQNISRLAPRSVYVEAESEATTITTTYTVYTFDDIIPGIFSKIAGVLAARGLQILDAQVDTRSNGVVVDTFRVSDPHFTGLPPSHRLEEVKEKIARVLLGELSVETLFPQTTRFVPALRPIAPKPTSVEIDNETSDQYTVIDIFAQDKQGLLYIITRAMFDLGLSVYSSKIATRLDQIVDVFYVKNQHGEKITEPDILKEIKERLSAKIHLFLESG